MDKLLLFAISLAGACVSVAMIACFMRTALDVFHPFVILFVVSVIDVYFPGIVWSFTGVPIQPEWVNPLTNYDVTLGVLIYLVSYLVMVGGYFLFGVIRRAPRSHSNYVLKERFLVAALWILLALCLLQLALTIASYGSVPEWFYRKIMVRWDGGLGEERETSPLELLPLRIVFSMLVIVGFYYRNTLNRPLVLGYFFPTMALILAGATFFRGSILVFLLGLLFVERVRVRKFQQPTPGVRRNRIVDKTLIKWTAFALALFVLYGGIRQQLSSESWGDETSSATPSSSVVPFSKGDGLVGMSSIVKFFDTPKDVFFGKTYLDMLLLPVPRSIYTSKPKWYGIDDITRSMGWAESTQSAVTMPGEAFANFWYLSLIFMLVIGAFFALINRWACSSGEFGVFLYPSALLYVVINSNWMAFTGIANQLLPGLLCAGMLRLIYCKEVAMAMEGRANELEAE